MERRRVYTKSLLTYSPGLYTPELALKGVLKALEEQQDTPAIDPFDAAVRDKNLETLAGVRDRIEREITLRDERMKAVEKQAADEKVQREADRKAEALADLRRGFAGSDAEWERLKDRVYDNYLINAPGEFEAAVEKAKATGRYSL